MRSVSFQRFITIPGPSLSVVEWGPLSVGEISTPVKSHKASSPSASLSEHLLDGELCATLTLRQLIEFQIRCELRGTSHLTVLALSCWGGVMVRLTDLPFLLSPAEGRTLCGFRSIKEKEEINFNFILVLPVPVTLSARRSELESLRLFDELSWDFVSLYFSETSIQVDMRRVQGGTARHVLWVSSRNVQKFKPRLK